MTGLTETITLAGREYEVREPSIADNRKFRSEVNPVFDYLPTILEKLQTEFDEVPDLGDAQGLTAIALEVGPLLVQALGSIDRMIELTFLGAPALSEDRERIEVEGHLSEFFAAFLGVLKLNFPLAQWGRQALMLLETSTPEAGSNGARTGSKSSEPSTERKRKRSPELRPANS